MLAKEIFPEAANPAETETRFPSAIPTLKNLFGNSFPNPDVFRESVVSAPKTTTLEFSFPTWIRVLEYSDLMSLISGGFKSNSPPEQFL